MLKKVATLHSNALENFHPGSTKKIVLEIKTTRADEETPEAMSHFLASLGSMKRLYSPFIHVGIPVSFEIALIEQMIHFFVTIPSDYQSFLESQLIAQYPKALIVNAKDYLPEITKDEKTLSVGQLKLLHGTFYPLRTYADFKEIDPLSSILGLLSKSQEGDKVAIQFMLVPAGRGWQRSGEKAAGKQTDLAGTEQTNPYAKVIQEKIAVDGFKVAIRMAVNTPTKERSQHLLQQIGTSFGAFNNPTGNGLVFRRPLLWQKDRLINAMLTRSRHFMPKQILNVHEIATLFHFPTAALATINNISWHKSILSEPPELLPTVFIKIARK